MVAKRPGRASDYPHPSSAESKSAWNYTSTHTYLHRVVGYEVRERFFTRPITSLIQKQTSHQFGNKLFEIHYDATDIAIYKCLLKVGVKKIKFILFVPVINHYTELH
jgi:hypothetical protein